MVKEFQRKNYWAVILGGSSGLGLATAKKLAKHGMHICVIHRNSRAQLPEIEKEFEQIKSEGVQFISFNIDVCNKAKQEATLNKVQEVLNGQGKIKTLIHSIAKGNLKSMISDGEAELQAEDFTLTINNMAISLYDWVKAIFKLNLFADDTRIISFTSEGNTKAWQNYAAVSAAKVTLEAITRNIALEFVPYGIRANCIQAGVTDTESLRMIPGSKQLKKHSLERNPFKRLTKPEDVANAAYLLCKKEAKWINGTIIKVDGGESLS